MPHSGRRSTPPRHLRSPSFSIRPSPPPPGEEPPRRRAAPPPMACPRPSRWERPKPTPPCLARCAPRPPKTFHECPCLASLYPGRRNTSVRVQRTSSALDMRHYNGPVRLLLIVNVNAQTVTPRKISVIERALSSEFKVELVSTERRGHAIDLAKDAVREGFDLVVAMGGDGTVNEAANGLAG